MATLSPALRYTLEHPLRFSWQVLLAFRANQGMLLAASLAYYSLLSLIPLLLLILLVMTRLYDSQALIQTVSEYLGQLLPGREHLVLNQITGFIDNPDLVGWTGIVSLLFFSSFAFRTLETSLSVILTCEEQEKRRHFLVSVLIPYSYILILALALVMLTMLSGFTEAMQKFTVVREFGATLGLDHHFMIRLLTIVCEFLLMTSFYLIMPVCQPRLRHAVVGGLAAMGLWEGARSALFWYLANWSQVNIFYGTFATTVIILLSMEVMAVIILLGAQVMAEYRRLNTTTPATETTEAD